MSSSYHRDKEEDTEKIMKNVLEKMDEQRRAGSRVNSDFHSAA